MGTRDQNRTRPNSDFEKAIECVEYEIEMLNRCVAVLRQLEAVDSDDRFQWSVHTESMLIHARNLYNFFFKGDETGPLDIIAADFFAAGNQWNFRHDDHGKKYCPYLFSERQAINSALAHLSWNRLKLSKEWKSEDIVNQLSEMWKLFREKLEQRPKPGVTPTHSFADHTGFWPHGSTASQVSDTKTFRFWK